MTSSLAETPPRGRALSDPDHDDDSYFPTIATRRATPAPRRRQPQPQQLGLQGGANVNEGSPLLSPASDGDSDDDDEDEEDNGLLALAEDERFHATKSVWYLVLLTVSIGGLQIAWSVELSNGSPYLLSLGLSKSLMALVWIAGPLSGTLVQPYVGMLSDNCRVPWGKRKPFMLAGAAATILSLMFLAWTKEIVGGILGLFGVDADSYGMKMSIIVVAVLWVYILDFAINTVQAAIRAFIVDCAPPQQQEAANAMASRMTGVGNIIGYLAGFVNLPKIVGFLGNTQFKALCAIASFALAATVVLSCLLIPERDPRLEGPPPKDQPGVFSFFRKIFTSIRRLPPQTKKVCMVQFCAWIGFFPMLFYTSSYIGEIYVEPFLEQNPNMTPEELDRLYERATRVGTFALLIFAIVSLATNVFLPFFIAPTFDSVPVAPGEENAALKDYEPEKKSWLDWFVIPGFTLRRAWMMSQVLFTVSMLCTVFVRTVEAAIALIGLVGITWALTLWAPWAIISAEISRRDAMLRAKRAFVAARDSDGENAGPADGGYSTSADPERLAAAADLEDLEEADQAGVILGIHNMAIAAPQIIATVASSVIFRVFQKPRGVPGDHSIAIVLAMGGITVLISVFFIYRIRDDPVDQPADGDDAAAWAVVEQDDAGGAQPPMRVRSRSYEQIPRTSQERAHLVRNRSFGGAEY